MKEKILKLRRDGKTYNEIKKELGCSKGTISYHCKNEDLSKPLKSNKLSDDIIEGIKKDSEYLSTTEICEKYDIGATSVRKYSGLTYEKEYNKKCENCKSFINNRNKFCSLNCFHLDKHKKAYDDFLKNNHLYCRANYSPRAFRDFFLAEQNYECLICKMSNVWMDKELIFVIDHIDGDASNNNRDNLRMICPNCDSQTDTFKSKNKNSTRRNYWKEKILNSIKK
jgi:Zn finger protein HypA/HybF involved in hydrogenase expression